MENQLRQEKDGSCECTCHPESGGAGCPGCTHKHGGLKMGSMDPFEMVMPMWYKASTLQHTSIDDSVIKRRGLSLFLLWMYSIILLPTILQLSSAK